MTRYAITINVPSDWIENAEDLKTLLEREANLWAVTHCDDEIEVTEVTSER